MVNWLCTLARCTKLMSVLIRLTLNSMRDIGSLTDRSSSNRLCLLTPVVSTLVRV